MTKLQTGDAPGYWMAELQRQLEAAYARGVREGVKRSVASLRSMAVQEAKNSSQVYSRLMHAADMLEDGDA